MTPQTSTTTLDLFSARAVISGTDFRIQEFNATGTILRQPFSVSVKLRTHEYVGGAATDESFAITPGPDDVVLEGQADEDPVTELMTTVLRELGRGAISGVFLLDYDRPLRCRGRETAVGGLL